MVMSGYSLAQAMLMLVPEAWEKSTTMDPDRRAFYAYHAPMMEAWDGPAAIVFTDGVQIGATLDRNGLRPARYVLTDDDTVVLASEVGVLPIPESRIRRKWRVEPGKMLLIDTGRGRIIEDDEIKNQLALAKPYREWVDRLNLRLADLAAPPRPSPTKPSAPSASGSCNASSASPRRTSTSFSCRWPEREWSPWAAWATTSRSRSSRRSPSRSPNTSSSSLLR